MFGLEPNDSLERRPGETARAFEAYRVYRNLGPTRNLKKTVELVYGSSGKGYGTIEGWSSKFDWRQRVEAFDSWLAMRDDMVLEQYRSEAMRSLAKREATHRETTFTNEERAAQLESKLLDRFEKVLEQLPLVEQRVVKEENGIPVAYVIKPVVANPDLGIKRLHDVASRGLPSKLEIENNVNVGGLTDEEKMEIEELRKDPNAGEFFSKLFPNTPEEE